MTVVGSISPVPKRTARTRPPLERDRLYLETSPGKSAYIDQSIYKWPEPLRSYPRYSDPLPIENNSLKSAENLDHSQKGYWRNEPEEPRKKLDRTPEKAQEW